MEVRNEFFNFNTIVLALIRLLDRGTLHLTISSARMSMKASIISLVWPADRQNLGGNSIRKHFLFRSGMKNSSFPNMDH